VFQRAGHELRSGSTYGGHTLACAATLANIEAIESGGLVEQARAMGAYLRERLEALRRHKLVGALGGIGLLQAVFLVADNTTNAPLPADLKVGSFIRDFCYDSGMILRNNGDILVMAPALIITQQQIDEAIEVLDRGLGAAIQHFGL
jgi:adenosylmethionine-8-amino-7-oxononanoate aminotransferase